MQRTALYLHQGSVSTPTVVVPLAAVQSSRVSVTLVVRVGVRGKYFHEHISDSVAAVHLPRGPYCDKRVRQHATQMEEMEWEMWCLHEGILISRSLALPHPTIRVRVRVRGGYVPQSERRWRRVWDLWGGGS